MGEQRFNLKLSCELYMFLTTALNQDKYLDTIGKGLKLGKRKTGKQMLLIISVNRKQLWSWVTENLLRREEHLSEEKLKMQFGYSICFMRKGIEMICLNNI